MPADPEQDPPAGPGEVEEKVDREEEGESTDERSDYDPGEGVKLELGDKEEHGTGVAGHDEPASDSEEEEGSLADHDHNVNTELLPTDDDIKGDSDTDAPGKSPSHNSSSEGEQEQTRVDPPASRVAVVRSPERPAPPVVVEEAVPAPVGPSTEELQQQFRAYTESDFYRRRLAEEMQLWMRTAFPLQQVGIKRSHDTLTHELCAGNRRDCCCSPRGLSCNPQHHSGQGHHQL